MYNYKQGNIGALCWYANNIDNIFIHRDPIMSWLSVANNISQAKNIFLCDKCPLNGYALYLYNICGTKEVKL